MKDIQNGYSLIPCGLKLFKGIHIPVPTQISKIIHRVDLNLRDDLNNNSHKTTEKPFLVQIVTLEIPKIF